MSYRTLAAILAITLSCSAFAEIHSIRDIRSEYKAIRDALPTLNIFRFSISKYGGGDAEVYVDHLNEIRMIRFVWGGETAAGEYEELYYLDGEIFFALLSGPDFGAPEYESRCYFVRGEMVRLLEYGGHEVDEKSVEFSVTEQYVKEWSERIYENVRGRLYKEQISK